MKTLTKEETTELAALRLIAARHDAAWKKHASFSRGGASSATQEQQARIRADVGQDFTNEQRSRLEVLEFVANPPDRYFAYIREDDRGMSTLHFRPYAGDGARFTLTTWDTDEQRDGKNRLCYQLIQRSQGKRVVLFQGDDFFCAPGHAVDSDRCVESIMSFLTLRPGDTDSDYFKDYNETQKEFCAQHAESLACEVQNRFCDKNS